MSGFIHRLKTTDLYWDAIQRGEKTFEVRKNDRAFQTGDVLELLRVDQAWPNHYGPVLRYRITYILQGGQFGIEPAYCVMGLGPIGEAL